MFERLTTTERALRKFLSMKEVDKPFCCVVNGRLLTGRASKHLTRSGVKFNNLLRLKRRIKQWNESQAN